MMLQQRVHVLSVFQELFVLEVLPLPRIVPLDIGMMTRSRLQLVWHAMLEISVQGAQPNQQVAPWGRGMMTEIVQHLVPHAQRETIVLEGLHFSLRAGLDRLMMTDCHLRRALMQDVLRLPIHFALEES
jgi:hypothetical protein